MDWRKTMTFKEQLQQDIKDVFFDIDIFGETHMVNDAPMSIMIDNEALKKVSATQKEHTDGIFVDGLLFYVSMAELGALPSVGNVLYLDDTMYRVFSAKEYDGVAEIVLEANTAWTP